MLLNHFLPVSPLLDFQGLTKCIEFSSCTLSAEELGVRVLVEMCSFVFG